MVDKSHRVHHSSGTTPPVGAEEKAKGPRYGQGGQVKGEPMTFLGMDFTAEESKQLWNVLIQNINSQIAKQKDRALAALKKLKKSETGDDTDD
ncbi:MAG: hypothetical protein A3E80_01605 [Chlamydiae bacterium RIFCSPHIGHO2_12_FULL_49_9]|nr:MAG: hypothetical protein A3E80_01605 [Chlamydiae bacterium RIFCSPHIGHO2_12_FULL_49_9]